MRRKCGSYSKSECCTINKIININIKGRGNGHDTVVNPDGDDPVIKQITNHEITINQVNINDYTEGEEYEINVQ